MKILQLLENTRAGFTKKNKLSDEISDKYVTIFRALPLTILALDPDSYVTRSKKFAIEHAISSANYEDEPFHVIKAMVKTEDVYNANNPGEYIYSGPSVKAKSIFVANPGDDFQ